MFAGLALGRLKDKRAALEQVLNGRFTDHHAFVLRSLLAHLEFLEAQISSTAGSPDTVANCFTDWCSRRSRSSPRRTIGLSGTCDVHDGASGVTTTGRGNLSQGDTPDS